MSEAVGLGVEGFKVCVRAWKGVRMILPFRDTTKALWHLEEHVKDIEWAINLRTDADLFFEIRRLYPKLTEHGIVMPDPPVDAPRLAEYSAFWPGYHRMILGQLRNEIRDRTFNRDRWNGMVGANERHLRQAIERERSSLIELDE